MGAQRHERRLAPTWNVLLRAEGDDGSGLSSGAIAGIVIGVLAVAGLIAFVVIKKRKAVAGGREGWGLNIGGNK